MKLCKKIWIEHKLSDLLLLLTCFSVLCSCESREGYFNGRSYAVLSNVLSLHGRTSFSFQTCADGELLYQKGSSGDFIQFSLLPNGHLVLNWNIASQTDSVNIDYNLKDNKWHNVDLHNQLNILQLKVDNLPAVTVSTTSFRSYLFTANLVSDNPSLYIGRNFTGCVLEGTSVVLSDPTVTDQAVKWSGCPKIKRTGCDGYLTNKCFNEPCYGHSECLSTDAGFTCRCATKFSGEFCEIDEGLLCLRPGLNQCRNGGTCVEDPSGNYTFCACTDQFIGHNCEMYSSSSLCLNNPCRNFGTCISSTQSDYNCVCPQGFTGTHCEFNVDECQSNPCLNNGTCTDETNLYSCDCKGTGFRGKNCEENINECNEQTPCGSGSTCYDRYGDYLCACALGRGGQNCQVLLDGCSTEPCKNGATCVTQDETYECRCLLGYEGTQCEVNIDDCSDVMCPHNSHCVDGINTYTCECDQTFSGNPPNCVRRVASLRSNPCDEHNCLNGATCLPNDSNFTCACSEGFTGPTCALCFGTGCQTSKPICDQSQDSSCLTDHSPCDLLPCMNNGSCTLMANSYSCDCLPGWSGKNCELNIDECSSNPCLHGQCVDRVGSYFCICADEYDGKNCENSTNHCTSRPCKNNGICSNQENGFTCSCPPDFTGSRCERSIDACNSKPCLNGATCELSRFSNLFICHCKPGFRGSLCEEDINDCESANCPSFQTCYDLINGYECRCPEGTAGVECSQTINACLSLPCRNGTCIDQGGNYICVCPPGLTGRNCEQILNECEPSPCVYGLCQIVNGSYLCYCRPGYTGHFCHVEIDECLSNPCQNQGTCRNLISDYSCDCEAGFEGRDCEIDINECEKDPCQNGATCYDGINQYRCSCLAGFTSVNCEVNIDECQSGPCFNNGSCIDKINSFQCDCSDVGFTGINCEINIDDCALDPCQNGATCEDKIKDYFCHCYSGYKGKNCEEDIRECESNPCQNDSPCLENSNRTLYEINYQGQYTHFSYENAEGYRCLCATGFNGINCEINIDDCEHHNCVNGTCIDGINFFNCSCYAGFEGSDCSIEINECDLYQPCQNGASCNDLIADYKCNCLPEFGGKNCETELQGCKSSPCKNDALCIPYLDYEVHVFRCICPLGFTGTVCDVSNTVSFSNSSWMRVSHYEQSPSNTYALNFQFKSTLKSGVLAHASDINGFFYVLYLENGSVNLAIENLMILRWVKESDRAPSMNDGTWKNVSVRISTTRVVLNVSNWIKEETLHFENIRLHETTVGGGSLPGSFLRTAGSIPDFIGCIREMTIGDHIIVPENEIRENAAIGCDREEVCLENTCSRIGLCQDLWFSHQCVCPRPYFGSACHHSVIPGTFGHEGIQSWVEVEIPGHERRELSKTAELSVFLRTREEDGFVFYIGPSLKGDRNQYIGNGQSQGTFLALFVESGLLKAITGSSEEMTETILIDKRINDGYYHFVKVFQNASLLTISVNETSIEEVISRKGFLSADFLYIGGLPLASSRVRRQLNRNQFNTLTWENVTSFRGIIQDFRINNRLIEFYPTVTPYSIVSDAPGLFTSNIQQHNISSGVVSDNPCKNDNPCLNGGSCTDIWNAYECICSPGFRGVNCTEHEPCYLYQCPTGSSCNNLESGYECVAEASFRNVGLKYKSHFTSNITSDSISFKFRSQKPGGTILHIFGTELGSKHHLSVTANDSLLLSWNFSSGETIANLVVGNNVTDGNWHTVHIFINGTIVKAVLDTNDRYAEYTSSISLTDIVKESTIFVGLDPNDLTSYFRGCLDNVRIGDVLLPFFMRDQLINDSSPNRFELQNDNGLRIGCTVCWNEDCLNEGFCQNETEDFNCHCNEGYNGSFCQDDVNECLNYPCQNEGKCINQLGTFHCGCVNYYTGKLCEYETNFCQPDPCQNNGKCTSEKGNYKCDCTEEFKGTNCSEPILVTCANNPCMNAGTCVNTSLYNGVAFECECLEGYNGTLCQSEIDYCQVNSQPCENGANCSTKPKPFDGNIDPKYFCSCLVGYSGIHCTEEIDPCLENDCESYQECHKTKEDYIIGHICVCPAGLEGDKCDQDINECLITIEICQNFGVCNNTFGSYVCSCVPGFIGINCSHSDPCYPDNQNNTLIKCENGGSCKSQLDPVSDIFEPSCKCQSGFSGRLCDTKAEANQVDNLALAIGLSLGVICVICIIVAMFVFLRIAKKKRATRGTYSPSRQEMFGSRVEMNHVIKPPPEERLI